MTHTTQTSIHYARVLADLPIPEEDVKEAERVFKSAPELKTVLSNPLISKEVRERIIERIFPESFRNFLKVACLHDKTGHIEEMFECYGQIMRERRGTLSAEILCVTPPSEVQLKGIRQFLCSRYQKNDVEFEVHKDPSLIGGFILRAGDFEYDYSLKGKYRRLEQQLTRR